MRQQLSSVENGGWAAALIVSACICLYYGLQYSLGEGVWFDEALTTYFVGLGWGDLFHFMALYEANMALYYFVLKIWSSLTGSELWLRLFSLLCYAAALRFMFLPLRRHFGSRAAFAFLVLCLSHFYLARYSVEIRGYALALFFMALLWFSWTRIVLDGEQKYWLLYAVTGAFAVHSHFFIALGILCLGLMALPALRGREDFFRWLGAHGLIGLSFLPILAFVIFKESGQLAWLGTPDLRSLIYLSFDYSGSAPQASDLVRFGLLLIIGALVIIGFIRLVRSGGQFKLKGNSQLQFWIGTLVIALVPVGIVFMVSQFKPIFSTRFFTPFMPFYLMLGAIGMVSVFRSWSLGPVIMVMALMTLSTHAHTNRESNRWAGAFSYLTSHCRSNQAVLYMNPRGQAAINYYEKHSSAGCNLDALPFELVPENYFNTPDEYPEELKGLEQYDTVWLVMTHLSQPETRKVAQYRRQIESKIGSCQHSYSNVAVEILRCALPSEPEAMKAP